MPIPRAQGEELMDQPDADRDDLDRSLRFIDRVNVLLGGNAALRHAVRRAGHRPGREPGQAAAASRVRLLDVGTGSAAMLIDAVRWAETRGIAVEATGIELHPVTAQLARQRIEQARMADRVTIQEIDARALPPAFQSTGPEPRFDLAHASLFLHHLTETEAVNLLRDLGTLATRVVWGDLIRSRAAVASAKLITLGAGPMVKHDAVLSVRKGFTPAEARGLAQQAGLTVRSLRANRVFQRFTLIAEPA